MNNLIKISDKSLNWEDAIREGVDLLVQNDVCLDTFADEIIKSVEKFGPYFILMPKLALAHAAPGDYIKKNGLSLIVFKDDVKFSDSSNHDVQLLFTLAAKDESSHIDLLMKFAELFQEDKELINRIIKLDNIEEIKQELKGLL
ncbi:MAG: PTS sugar transporter subunit IIA [Metamycoplasmataceae bacterium]